MERDKKKGKGGGEWATLSTGHWDSLSWAIQILSFPGLWHRKG
jgi:hypothetical protein